MATEGVMYIWVNVCHEENNKVRRMAIPGGWLIQVESGAVPTDYYHTVTAWSAPVFVPNTISLGTISET